jgi:succinate dehydrogenase / fumarate reductase, cytochrome b subunit
VALPLTTDQPDRPAPPDARAVARTFIGGRLGSVFAILPLGVWTVNHLWNNLAAFNGDRAWQTAVTQHSSNASTALVSTVVLVPLLWHTLWGIGRMFRTRGSSARYFGSLRYWLQRASAVGLLAFLCAHLWLAWVHPRFVEGHPETFADISHEMHFESATLIVYILGIVAIAYHLANGLWSFCTMGWGLAVSKSSIKWLERIALIVFLLLLAIGWGAVYGIYSGAT